MNPIAITYKEKKYTGHFKEKGHMVTVYYGNKKKSTRRLGTGDQTLIAKQLLEDLIRPHNERPSYISKQVTTRD